MRALCMILVCVVCASGCTRGKKKEDKPVVAEVPVKPIEAPAHGAPASDDGWLEGKLPASVMSGTPRSGGDLIVGLSTDPPSLNGYTDSDLVGSWITSHRIYQSLVNVDPLDDPQYRVVPELAESWDVSDDKKTFTFHLRKGVKWHDGQPFSARDVIATLDKVQDPTTKAVHVRSYTQELASYNAPDEYTVVFVWKRPYFLTLDTMADLSIQPAHVIGKLTGRQYNDAATNPLNRAPVGTGPFKFVSWESNSKIVIAKNDAYWGKKPYLDRVLFRIQQDPTVMMQLVERGEVDLSDRVTTDAWVAMADSPLKKTWNRSKFYSANYGFIGWNTERPMFSDKRVRRALTLLIDRPGIVQKMLHGIPKPTNCHFYWRSPSCDPALVPLPYDAAAGARLLDEAGWKDTNDDGVRDKGGKPFKFVFMLPSGAVEGARWAAKIKEDLGRVGIDMDLQVVEWSAFTKRLNEHAFDACTLAWGGGPRGDPTQIWHSSSIKGGSNFISYKSAEVDKLLEDARVLFDETARDALYKKFGAILQDEQPYTFMYVRPELNLVHKKVHGAQPSLMWWQFENMWIEP